MNNKKYQKSTANTVKSVFYKKSKKRENQYFAKNLRKGKTCNNKYRRLKIDEFSDKTYC